MGWTERDAGGIDDRRMPAAHRRNRSLSAGVAAVGFGIVGAAVLAAACAMSAGFDAGAVPSPGPVPSPPVAPAASAAFDDPHHLVPLGAPSSDGGVVEAHSYRGGARAMVDPVRHAPAVTAVRLSA